MKWFYLALWLIFLLCRAAAARLHEDKLVTKETEDRLGFWEMLWYGVSCIACYQFFEEW